MRNTRRNNVIGQFLVGVAIATVAGTVIAPLSTRTFDPGLAVSGLIVAIALVLIAMFRDRVM